jgi:hypothetical protein
VVKPLDQASGIALRCGENGWIVEAYAGMATIGQHPRKRRLAGLARPFESDDTCIHHCFTNEADGVALVHPRPFFRAEGIASNPDQKTV